MHPIRFYNQSIVTAKGVLQGPAISFISQEPYQLLMFSRFTDRPHSLIPPSTAAHRNDREAVEWVERILAFLSWAHLVVVNSVSYRKHNFIVTFLCRRRANEFHFTGSIRINISNSIIFLFFVFLFLDGNFYDVLYRRNV